MDEQQKIRAAMAKLTDVLAGIARTADEKNRERCPYKAVDLRCTYQGGCQNQRRVSTTVHCMGDELIQGAEYGIRDTEYDRPNHELRATDQQ